MESPLSYTVVPVMNGHPRDQAKVSVHCKWPLIRDNLTLKCVGRGFDNVAVQGRWPLTTGVAQGRYYCTLTSRITRLRPVAVDVSLPGGFGRVGNFAKIMSMEQARWRHLRSRRTVD